MYSTFPTPHLSRNKVSPKENVFRTVHFMANTLRLSCLKNWCRKVWRSASPRVVHVIPAYSSPAQKCNQSTNVLSVRQSVPVGDRKIEQKVLVTRSVVDPLKRPANRSEVTVTCTAPPFCETPLRRNVLHGVLQKSRSFGGRIKIVRETLHPSEGNNLAGGQSSGVEGRRLSNTSMYPGVLEAHVRRKNEKSNVLVPFVIKNVPHRDWNECTWPSIHPDSVLCAGRWKIAVQPGGLHSSRVSKLWGPAQCKFLVEQAMEDLSFYDLRPYFQGTGNN